MCTVLAGLRAWTSNSRGAFATWSSTKSGSRNTVSPSTFWPAWRNSSTASGLANCTPISETMRRHPLSRTVTASGDRISYRGIVLRNIATSFQLGPAFVLGPSCLGPVPEQASLDRPNTPNVRSHSRTEFHSMELPWSRLPWSRGARGDQSHRNAGGRPGGTAAHRGRTLPRLGDLHGAGGRHRAGQEHHVAAAARAGAWRAGPPGRRGPGPAPPGARPGTGARRGGAEAGLVDVAQPYLDRLGEATGEAVNLGVERGGLVEQIAQVDSTYLIGGTHWLSRPVPPHGGALGRVLLASGPAELPRGRLERCTARTITSRAELDANLAEVRERGYAITDEELEPGLVAVAAPVRRDGGTVVAALSVSAPATRLTPARMAGVAAECAAQAAAVSAALGHRQQAPGTLLAQTPANPQKEGAA